MFRDSRISRPSRPAPSVLRENRPSMGHLRALAPCLAHPQGSPQVYLPPPTPKLVRRLLQPHSRDKSQSSVKFLLPISSAVAGQTSSALPHAGPRCNQGFRTYNYRGNSRVLASHSGRSKKGSLPNCLEAEGQRWVDGLFAEATCVYGFVNKEVRRLAKARARNGHWGWRCSLQNGSLGNFCKAAVSDAAALGWVHSSGSGNLSHRFHGVGGQRWRARINKRAAVSVLQGLSSVVHKFKRGFAWFVLADDVPAAITKKGSIRQGQSARSQKRGERERTSFPKT